MTGIALDWLPPATDFRAQLNALSHLDGAAAWHAAVALAGHDLDFVQTGMLDRLSHALAPEAASATAAKRTNRLAILGTCTTSHLLASIRVAGLRRNFRVVTYETHYGQYRQELLDPDSPLRAFEPDTVLFSLDAHSLTAQLHGGFSTAQLEALLDSSIEDIAYLWRLARESLQVTVLQQAALPLFPDLLGNNEHRLPGSHASFIERLNDRLRAAAEREDVHLVATDRWAARTGLDSWYDPALWHRAKQEISPRAAPLYGDLIGRLLAAISGGSCKALVMDLDNTLWGGVIGDDGLGGLKLGAGSAAGEAFAAVQRYARNLAERGVILAVCSKNTEAVARQAFDTHPEMVLKREHVASFVANWADKATNLRRIAAELNIGLDALVFVDDNPAERALIRRALPQVAVPEIPADPALIPRRLAAAGYFEGIAITAEDRARTDQYQLNRSRQEFATKATDLEGYLRSLEMQLHWLPFDTANLPRIAQLINKTNQFNLTTRRYTERQLRDIMDDPDSFGISLRLLDRFGDNGIIAVVIGRLEAREVRLDTWLMSCRVLGRRVEHATLSIAISQARRLGGDALVGEYIPTTRNEMVVDHYPRLSFRPDCATVAGIHRYRLALDTAPEHDTFMSITRS